MVGAGPAGLHAALAAADAGVDVLLVDSAPAVGGQFYRQMPDEFGAARPEEIQHGHGALKALRGRIEGHPRIEHLRETSVWAVEPGRRLHLLSGPADAPGRRTSIVDADAVVIATGAYDRVLPFPGWDLPGVYTAGAAQALAKGQRIAVGERVLVAGTGPFLLPVAESLLGTGAQVVAVLEANAATRSARAWTRHPQAIVAQGNKLGELGHYARVLARHRIPYRTRTTVVEAHGTDRLAAVTIARLDPDWHEVPGTRRRIEVDALAVGHGFTPQLDVALAAGCQTEDDFVAVDHRQTTSTDGVFAAGEITGIGGAVLAADEGTLAGLAAADHLGAPVPDRAIDKAVRRVRRAQVFAATLAAAYPIGAGWRDRVAADTLVCRCEEVSHAALAEAVTERGATGARSLKLLCRAGLGPCQGRVCGRNVTDLADTLLTAAGSPPLTDRQATSRRPIVTPIRLGDLAAAAETEENP